MIDNTLKERAEAAIEAIHRIKKATDEFVDELDYFDIMAVEELIKDLYVDAGGKYVKKLDFKYILQPNLNTHLGRGELSDFVRISACAWCDYHVVAEVTVGYANDYTKFTWWVAKNLDNIYDARFWPKYEDAVRRIDVLLEREARFREE